MRDIGGERKKKKKDLTYFQFEFQQDKKEENKAEQYLMMVKNTPRLTKDINPQTRNAKKPK